MSRAPPRHRDHDDESSQNTTSRGRHPSGLGPFREILSRESAPVAEKNNVSGAAGLPSPVTRKSNVSSACTPCRRLKTKCDGRTPCSSCVSKGTEEACIYDVDNRRKGVLKRMLHDSQQETTQLQSILDYLRSANATSAAAVLSQIRQGLTTSELIRYIETLPAAGVPKESVGAEDLEGVHQHGCRDVPGPLEWTSVVQDQGILNHLVDLFFCWQYHQLPILSKPDFLDAMKAGDTRFCSPALVNAILAAGCSLYEPADPSAYPQGVKVLADQFMEEAERLIQEELVQGKYTLTSIQALAIMSMQDIAAGKETIMWFHLGLAVMMAINLALDNDASHDAAGTGESGRLTYWGLFIADRLAAFTLGRLPQMRTVGHPRKPQHPSIGESDIWVPMMNLTRESGFRRPENFAQVVSCQYELFEIVNDILSSFYHPGQDATTHDVNALYMRLLEWRNKQPTEMDPIPYAVPNIYHLRLLYHAAILILFRPYMQSTTEGLSVEPTLVCKEAASAILHIEAIYDQCYGLRFAPIYYLNYIYAAAFVYVTVLAEPQALKFFLQCMQYIKTMGKYYQRPAETAFHLMLSMLLKQDIKLPRSVRGELVGLVPLEPYEELFVDSIQRAYEDQALLASGLMSPGRPAQLGEMEQPMSSGTPGSLSFSDSRETPVEDFLVGELAFESGLLPDLLEDGTDDTLGRRW